jgi:hypothetical protein
MGRVFEGVDRHGKRHKYQCNDYYYITGDFGGQVRGWVKLVGGVKAGKKTVTFLRLKKDGTEAGKVTRNEVEQQYLMADTGLGGWTLKPARMNLTYAMLEIGKCPGAIEHPSKK